MKKFIVKKTLSPVRKDWSSYIKNDNVNVNKNLVKVTFEKAEVGKKVLVRGQEMNIIKISNKSFWVSPLSVNEVSQIKKNEGVRKFIDLSRKAGVRYVKFDDYEDYYFV